MPVYGRTLAPSPSPAPHHETQRLGGGVFGGSGAPNGWGIIAALRYQSLALRRHLYVPADRGVRGACPRGARPSGRISFEMPPRWLRAMASAGHDPGRARSTSRPQETGGAGVPGGVDARPCRRGWERTTCARSPQRVVPQYRDSVPHFAPGPMPVRQGWLECQPCRDRTPCVGPPQGGGDARGRNRAKSATGFGTRPTIWARPPAPRTDLGFAASEGARPRTAYRMGCPSATSGSAAVRKLVLVLNRTPGTTPKRCPMTLGNSEEKPGWSRKQLCSS